MNTGWLALAYLIVTIVALLVFAQRYKASKIRKLQNAEQFFPNKFGRDIYVSLAKQDGVPNKLAKAALLGWASESVGRRFQLMESAAPLKNLNEAGLINDDLFTRFTGTERLAMREMQDIASESEKRHAGWAQSSLLSAQEIVQNNALRHRLANIEAFRQEFRDFAK